MVADDRHRERVRLQDPVLPPRRRGVQDRRRAREGPIAASVWADWGGFKMEALDGDPRQRGAGHARRRARDHPLRRCRRAPATEPGDGEGDGGRPRRSASTSPRTRRSSGSPSTRRGRSGSTTRSARSRSGKNADVVLWSGDPFSVYTHAEKVWIDGALLFDRAGPGGATGAPTSSSASCHAAEREPTDAHPLAPGSCPRARLDRRPRAAAQTVAITGGTVYPVSGPADPNGTVLIVNGQITAVGAERRRPAGATRIDATGKWVTPGSGQCARPPSAWWTWAMAPTPMNRARQRQGCRRRLVPAVAGLQPGQRPDRRTTASTASRPSAIWPTRRADRRAGGHDRPRRGLAERRAAQGPGGHGGASSEDNGGAGGERAGRVDRQAHGAARRHQVLHGATRRPTTRAQDAGIRVPARGSRGDDPGRRRAGFPLVLNVDQASDIEAGARLGARRISSSSCSHGAAEGWKVAGQHRRGERHGHGRGHEQHPGLFTTLGARQDNAALLRKAGVAGHSDRERGRRGRRGIQRPQRAVRGRERRRLRHDVGRRPRAR